MLTCKGMLCLFALLQVSERPWIEGSMQACLALGHESHACLAC